jgi:hypothetical protein
LQVQGDERFPLWVQQAGEELSWTACRPSATVACVSGAWAMIMAASPRAGS